MDAMDPGGLMLAFSLAQLPVDELKLRLLASGAVQQWGQLVASFEADVQQVALGALTFTRGMGVGANATISPAEISSQLGVRFEVNTALDTMPTPQFVIDQQEFDYRDIRATVRALPHFGARKPSNFKQGDI